MTNSDDRIDTLRLALNAVVQTLEAHMQTHNTGGGVIDRVAPTPLARARELLVEAHEQCPC